MKPTVEILENLTKNSKENQDEVFTRLYRYMLRPDLYYLAYKNLYANNGASTKGVNDDTADGFSEKMVQTIIKSLTDGTYLSNPARRTYIKKSNGKMRPLGIPTFTDKLVQEVLRMILEAVYEPVFLNCSHGFRPKRSCHTALGQITKGFNGMRWFVEGDIKGCFDNINHQVLVGLINGKIKDARIIQLIWKFLKAGYVEDWKYHATYSGTPQGGIISPLFANIYLHELDKFVLKLAHEFDQPKACHYTTEYNRLSTLMRMLNPKIEAAQGAERDALIAQKKALRAQKLRTPCKSQTDKKIKYVRYADDFLIGVNGGQEDCVEIKRRLTSFIANSLKMELSDEKTLITHSSEYARFLGYDVRVRRNSETKPSGQGYTKRTLNQKAELAAPLHDKVMRFLFDKGIIQQTHSGMVKPKSRVALLHCTDLEIVTVYNSELRGVCNYYSMAGNFCKLNYFAYLMKYSCLKTLAHKHKGTTAKMIRKFKDGKGKWGIPYETKNGPKRCYFADYRECRDTKNPSDLLGIMAVAMSYSRTTFESRLKAKTCELCGTTSAAHYEIHHVHKVKDLKGKLLWERMMIAKRRKTMVVCRACHHKIHDRSSQ